MVGLSNNDAVTEANRLAANILRLDPMTRSDGQAADRMDRQVDVFSTY
ncbi:hypothetical protein [Paenibacillus aestuarii]|uniref:Uncharacterized protein n=1 Tax=Paenibacillus aestuarii TaxID=516965 RepID=A0ABW0KAZ4_9BACL|nr:hypothetical protein [Paenibacillus aestuarii]